MKYYMDHAFCDNSPFLSSSVESFAELKLENVESHTVESDVQCTVDHKEIFNGAEPKLEQLPFENLVFEGGGAKGIAYTGALKYLETVGLLDPNGNHKIKRFAGTSAGAITATLLAIGCSADEVQEICTPTKIKSLIYGSGSIFRVLNVVQSICRLYKNYGFQTSDRVQKEMAKQIEKKTQNPDLTFRQLYNRNGKELCIVVTNLSNLTVDYLHPKTSPDVKIRDAVTMSMTIPAYFSAIKEAVGYGRDEDIFVDGGLLCNYPLHCFDGWFLSMKSEDSFMNRIQSIEDMHRLYDHSERFGKFNAKTLGLLIFADNDREWMKHHFDKRPGALVPSRPHPDTTLSLSKQVNHQKKKKTKDLYEETIHALAVFRQIAREKSIVDTSTINREEFHRIYNDNRLTKEMRSVLFRDLNEEEAFQYLDKNKSGKIDYQELMDFIQSLGICLQNKYIVFNRGEQINSLSLFFRSLASALLANSKLVFIQTRDRDRTIGINTGHVTTMDFDLEQGDIDFLIKRGENAARAYMRQYVGERNKSKWF